MTRISIKPIIRELGAVSEPWQLARRFTGWRYPLFLDSSLSASRLGRYSYFCADPVSLVRQLAPKTGRSDPFAALRFPSVEWASDTPLPPFRGGWAGLFGYHLGRAFDRQPLPRSDEFQLPDLVLGLYDWVISFDHDTGQAWLVSTGLNRGANGWECCPDRAKRRFEAVWQIISESPETDAVHRLEPSANGPRVTTPPGVPLSDFPNVFSPFSRDDYLMAVQQAIDYIHAGDCFQINLSQRLLMPHRQDPWQLYGRLRVDCPSPFGCFFDCGDFQILSASPERFVQMQPGGQIVTRPIKGTRPRGQTESEDDRQLRDLLTHPKDRAENVMIVDLLRNDLGRVCEFGSVKVPEVCVAESYSYVHHLVSEIRGQLRPGLHPFDLVRAVFPGGSVTGAPKVRAMEIIAELEPTARGPYCGSIGFIGCDGAVDSNILIRTITASRGQLQFPVGGGIVADSDPEREYEETLHKAAGLLKALGQLPASQPSL